MKYITAFVVSTSLVWIVTISHTIPVGFVSTSLVAFVMTLSWFTVTKHPRAVSVWGVLLILGGLLLQHLTTLIGFCMVVAGVAAWAALITELLCAMVMRTYPD